MLNDANSYIRSRAIILIADNARWDADFRLDEIIDEYLRHVTDDQPITARQCIQALPCIARFKPDLRGDIKKALLGANLQKYKASMRPLLLKDIQKALAEIRGLEQ